MFLEIEGNRLINLMLIQTVDMRHAKKECVVTIGHQVFESHIVYDYIMTHKELYAGIPRAA